MIKHIASLTHQHLHRPGDFCARYGGEEFAIVLPNTTTQGDVPIGNKVLNSIRQSPMTHEQESIWLTVSIGVCSQMPIRLSQEELTEPADKALYKAKASGRNKLVVHTSLKQSPT